MAAASSSAVSSSAGPPTGHARAVGTPAAAITCLAKDLLPSSCAACSDGPKQAMPASRTASAAPATSGTSGPMTTRSARHSTASAAIASGSPTGTASGSATARVPALPGAQASALTAGSEERATHRACSRAPEPITTTRTEGNYRPAVSTASALAERLGAQLPVERPQPRLLLCPRPRVDAQQLPVGLGLQLAPGHEPGGVEPAVVDGGSDGATGLRPVLAVAVAAAGGQLRHVGVGGVHAVQVVEQGEFAHARGVDQQPAAGQQVQLAG